MKNQRLSFFVATHLAIITTLGKIKFSVGSYVRYYSVFPLTSASAASLPRTSSDFTCESLSGCGCPGETYTCQCTVDRPGTTVWKGTLIQGSHGDCPTGIVLHRDNIPNECGGFIARGIHINDNTFTSQMNFTINTRYNGKTIECNLFSNDVLTNIGSISLNFTVGKFTIIIYSYIMYTHICSIFSFQLSISLNVIKN